jgi:hypothetical protein
MRPFIEVDNDVFEVVGWEPEMPDRERYEIRRLNPREARRYWQNREEMDVELQQNFTSGERPARA